MAKKCSALLFIISLIPVIFVNGCKTAIDVVPDEVTRDENLTLEISQESISQGQVVFDLGENGDAGLGILFFDDSDTEEQGFNLGTPNEVWCLRSGNGQALPSDDGNSTPDDYFRFDVSDDLLYQIPQGVQVQIEIEYLDEGTDNFNLEYDAQNSGPNGDGTYKPTDVIYKTDSGEFKTTVISLGDAYFGNRIQENADFRIDDNKDGAETICSISVKWGAYGENGEHENASGADEGEVTQLQDEIDAESVADGQANTIFFNGNVITMENGVIATAIGIQDDKIVVVGNDEEVLAHAGVDSVQIDLQGQTIMPGFIDGHTHILAFEDRLGRSFDQAQETAIRYGFTSLNEMWADSGYLENLFMQEDKGNLKLRVSVFAPYNLGRLDENRENIITDFWFPENDPILDPQRHVRVPGIKIFMDGDFTGGRGCWAMSEPLVVDSPIMQTGICGSEYGDLYWTQEEINQVVSDAQDKGYRVAFHAMGDQAIEFALNAIENSLDGQPNSIYRHQIEHNSMARPDQITRYKDLDILASIRGYGNFCVAEVADLPALFGPDRTTWYGNRYELANTIPHAYLETDYGWTVEPDDRYAQRNLDPIMHLYGLVTHRYVNADGSICDPVSWVAENRLSVDRALHMMTIEGAYAVSMEDYVGSLKPGKFADIIMLSNDPFTVSPDDLKDLEVRMTMIGGDVEYCATGNEIYCPN